MRKSAFIAVLAATTALTIGTAPAAAAESALQFNLVNIGGVDPGSNAYKGFNAAAAYWSSVLTVSQPTTINIGVGFDKLGEDILGSTGSTRYVAPIVNIQNRINNRATTAIDTQVVSGGQATLHDGEYGPFSVHVNTPGYLGVDADGDNYGIDNSTKVYDTDGKFNTTFVALNTANAKALGYTAADGLYNPLTNPNQLDGTITFSSEFAFDFNPRNGIAAGTSDFYAVAIHEIGHLLGFVSGVDDYDYLGTGGPLADEVCFSDGSTCSEYPKIQEDWWGSALDLFRYSAPGVLDWTTSTDSYFSIDGGLTAYQDGLLSTGSFNGDGWQASHWKAPTVVIDGETFFSCAQPKLGILNPYICSGREGIVTGRDLAVFDTLGYNTSQNPLNYNVSTGQIAYNLTHVPEPAAWAMMIAGFGLVGTSLRRQRKTGYASA